MISNYGFDYGKYSSTIHTEYDTVPAEGFEIVLLDVLHQEFDGKIDTANATSMPTIMIATSTPVKAKPCFTSFKRLAPNITGTARGKRVLRCQLSRASQQDTRR